MEDSIGLPVVNGFLIVDLGKSQGYDENGLLRSLNGRLTCAHTKCCAVLQRSRAKDDKISTWT